MAEPIVHPDFSALVAGDEMAAPARSALLTHLRTCAACEEKLAPLAPDLLLAALAEELPDPAPFDARAFAAALPARPAPLPRWLPAAAALVIAGALGALRLARRGAENSAAASAASSAHVTVAEKSAPRAPAVRDEAVANEAPVVETGAEAFQVREFTAAGFDGAPAQWVVLKAEPEPGEVRS